MRMIINMTKNLLPLLAILTLTSCAASVDKAKCDALFAAMDKKTAGFTKNTSTNQDVIGVLGQPNEVLPVYPNVGSPNSAADYYVNTDGSSGACGQVRMVYNNHVLVDFSDIKIY